MLAAAPVSTPSATMVGSTALVAMTVTVRDPRASVSVRHAAASNAGAATKRQTLKRAAATGARTSPGRRLRCPGCRSSPSAA